MKPLHATTNGASRGASTSSCAAALLDGGPGLFWYIRRHMRRHRKGVSVPQFRVLVKVQNDGEVSLSCVADHLGASLPTASRIVATLVDKGFLTRAHSTEDRRQLVLQVTSRGRAIAVAARAASLEQMQQEFAAVAAEDRAIICRAFEILSRFVGDVRLAAQAPTMASAKTAPRRPTSISRRVSRKSRLMGSSPA